MKNNHSDGESGAGDYRIDNLDRRILSCLMENATRSYADIARELTISNGTVHVRMKRLQEMGVVRAAHLVVDTWKLGFDLMAFVGVYLDRSSKYHNTVDAMRGIPEIVEVYSTTGSYSILMKVICRDSYHLFSVLKEKIQAIEGVVRTETFILLDEGIRRSVPLEDENESGRDSAPAA